MDKLIESANLIGLNINDKAPLFERYYNLLAEWNAKFNLTAVIEKDEVTVKHFIDSLYGEKYISKGATVIDIGSGAGFPSLPLKIVRPDIEVIMLDSLRKRVNFLECVIRELKLDGIIAVHSRAEDYVKKGAGQANHVLARAVAGLPTLIEYSMPLLKIGGTLIAYKSRETAAELKASSNALKELGAEVSRVQEFKLAQTEDYRTIIEIKKIKKTDKKYPRGGNKPRLQPL